MSGRLLDHLVEAGLVTKAQALACGPRDPAMPTHRVLQDLVAHGLDERTLAGFFVSKGFGPMLQAAELRRADRQLVQRMPAEEARALCAMPLRATSAGAVVAMADPTDEDAVEKLAVALGGAVLPTVAKLSDLLEAIEREYEDPVENDRTRRDFAVPHADFTSTASPVWDRAFSRSATEGDLALDARTSGIPLPSLSPAPSGERFAEAAEPDLESVRQAASRDEAVRRACEACLGASRGAAFLALRKGVFRGWDGAGDELTRAAIRSLWVPASNPSVLNEVLHTGKTFHGAYGDTAADQLFRAAVGRNGREVVIAPVLVGARMVGVLCANDPASDSRVIERVALALGNAFQRLIVARKSGT